MRVPGIAWMPSRVRPAVISQRVSTLDIFPSALSLAGAKLADDVTIDGRNIAPLLFEQKALPIVPFFYYRGDQLYACRLGDWKAHFRTQIGYGQPKPDVHDPPLLFHMSRDPSERFNVAAQYPQVIDEIRAAVKKHEATVVPGEPQLK
jgi:arylsulfatase A-like enzyme